MDKRKEERATEKEMSNKKIKIIKPKSKRKLAFSNWLGKVHDLTDNQQQTGLW